MGNLIMMTSGAVDSAPGDVKKQLKTTLESTWEAANYSLGLPFQHVTEVATKISDKTKAKGPRYKKYKKYKKYKGE